VLSGSLGGLPQNRQVRSAFPGGSESRAHPAFPVRPPHLGRQKYTDITYYKPYYKGIIEAHACKLINITGYKASYRQAIESNF
jgi:hypothetical protein